MNEISKIDNIVNIIINIRNQQVILDQDLAELYGIETKQLKRAVRRNIKRFPEDFMFELTMDELKGLRSQIGTSKHGGTRYRPMAFTEEGVAMLSSVINSEQAINVNIAIMRAFVQLRKMIKNYSELLQKINEIENKYDKQFKIVFEAIKKLMETPKTNMKQQIGF
ncbi:MAG: ORF6N domain-containing protein [Calditrichales bacterium]|nr:ORF6N domain-containing protein [Calditrichales bacterium]